MVKVLIASDHGALELKNQISKHLEKRGFKVEDLGVHDESSVDYPDIAEKACRKYLEGGYEFGVLACGTGIGISISANKIQGIRCALPQNSFAAHMAKEHNNANFIAFGGRIDYPEAVESMLDSYIDNTYSEEQRHHRRVDKINKLEQ